MRMCAHCKIRPSYRARGLCFKCYETPRVRVQYTRGGPHAHRGPGVHVTGNRLPTHPTDALPQTPEKIAVMCQRAMDGVSLFHPDDATWKDSPIAQIVGSLSA